MNLNFFSFVILKILWVFDFFYQKKMFKFLKEQKIYILDNFVDVGAHKGETINLFSKTFKIKNIYSFEPSPISFQILKKNKKIFKEKFKNININIYNSALGSQKRIIQLKHLIESSSSTLNELNEQSKYFKKKYFFLSSRKTKKIVEKFNVKQIKLGEFIKENKISKINYLKIDTEGYEFEVLKGCENIFEIIEIIQFEHHYDDMIKKNYKFTDINKLLVTNNFKQIYKSKMPLRKTFEYIYINTLKLN